MKQFRIKNLLIATALVSGLAACTKDKNEPTPIDQPVERAGLYVLNEGNFNANNSTLTYYNYSTKATIADQFNAVNNVKIGDTGNDAQVYGSKMYITFTVFLSVR